MMKEAKKETPKFYMLETVYDHPKTLKTEVMAGYRPSKNGRQISRPNLTSPIRALRGT
jgi:hypothetical protein